MTLKGLLEGGEGDFRLELANRRMEFGLFEPDFIETGGKPAVHFVGMEKGLQGAQPLPDGRFQGRFVLGRQPLGPFEFGRRLGERGLPRVGVVGQRQRLLRALVASSSACSISRLSLAWCTERSRVLQPTLPATTPTTSSAAKANTVAVASARLFRRANLRKRYHADGGQACTGSSCR